ncbi:MAG: serine/threonine-protein kinase, partial [Planctomycetota bacterium JB042]
MTAPRRDGPDGDRAARAFEEVRVVFERALDVAEGDRPAFLDRECAGRPAVRREVDELLEASDASRPLEPATGDDALPSVARRLAAPEVSETRVGRYRLGRVLASGGMGVVFEATQDRPRRPVAVKMMRTGLETPDGARRFRDEAEILARLRHPGIAQVYESGVHVAADPDGVTRELPWFAMELVEGARTIVRYAADAGPSTEERIELFLRVCDAVQHGHQRGVLHRDLKPENILVDGAGNPKVIDFGVARAAVRGPAASALHTRTGQVVGTLQYMAPEQMSDDPAGVDVRTDVHALGLVLFELLTGTHAFDFSGKAIHEIALALRTVPPRRLRSIDPGLADDLQIVVDTALAKDPDRRYASVAQLADDLRRFLAREPLAARPPSVAYQAKLFARRNRALVVSCAAIFVTSVVATVVSVRSAVRSAAAERIASDQRARAEDLLALLLEDSVDSLVDIEPRLAAVEGTSEVRRDLLRRAVDRLATLERRAGDGVEVLLLLARAYRRLGDLEGNPQTRSLGDLDAWRAAIDRADAVATRLSRAHPGDPRVGLELGRVRLSRAALAETAGDRDGAIDLYRAGITALTGAAGDGPLAVDVDLSKAYGHLVTALALSGRNEEATAEAEARIAVTRRALAAAPDDVDRLGNHAVSTGLLGMMRVQRGDHEGALALLEEAAATQAELYRRKGRTAERYHRIKLELARAQPR